MSFLSSQYVKQQTIPFLFRLRGGKDLWAEQDLTEYGIEVIPKGGACTITVPSVPGAFEGEEDVLPATTAEFNHRFVFKLDYATHGDCVRRWGAIVLPGGRALQTGVNHHMPRLAAILPRPFGRKRREDFILAPWPHSFMGYGDFCMCVLPRLCRILTVLSEREKSEACVALPFSKGPWARELVELVGIPQERQIDTLTENFGLSRRGVAMTVNAQSGVWSGPGDFEDLRAMIPLKPHADARKRYMIQRKGSRPLLEEKALFDSIKELGFELLEDRPRTIREQVELFRGAQCVVGPHGAGLSNILWGPDTLGLMEVQSISWVLPSFRFLSAIRRAPYRVILDHTAGGEARIEDGASLAPLHADPERFAASARLLCAEVERAGV